MISGAYQNHPSRKPQGVVPKHELPVGDPPAYFAANERRVWRELMDNLPPSVPTKTDRMVFELTCVLMAKFRKEHGLPVNELAKLITCLSLIGATPVDRARLAVAPAQKEAAPFEEFAAKATA